ILATPYNALYAQPVGDPAGQLVFLRGKTLFAQPFDPDRLTLGGAPRAIAENIGARGPLGQFSVSQNGVLTTSAAGNMFRSVTIVSREGATIETVGKPDAHSSLRLSPDGRSVALTHSNLDST